MNDSDKKAATTAPWLGLTDVPSAADPDDVEPAVSVDVPADAPIVELPGCSLLVADSLISSVDGPAVSCKILEACYCPCYRSKVHISWARPGMSYTGKKIRDETKSNMQWG